MTVAIAYGGALLVSGWLLSRGAASAQHSGTLRSLGLATSEGKQQAWWRHILPHATRGRERALRAVAALGAGALGYLLMGPVGVLAGSIGGPALVKAREARAALARREQLDRQLADAIVTVSASVRAGLSIRRAIAEACEEASPPLKGELESVLSRLETGEPLDLSLSRLDRNLRLSDAKILVNALAVHRRTGGDLPALLDEIARVSRTRLEDRRSVRALTAQARSSGVVLALLPVGFVALLSGTGGGGLGDFYRTPSGAVLLLLAMCLQALGFVWMRWIVQRVESP